MKEKKQTFIVSKEGTLLDTVKSLKTDLSNKTIKSFIKNKMVKINNKVITNSGFILKNGDVIEISYSKRIIPNFDLDIIYEDNYLIAINKPCGLLSISNDKEKIVTAYRMVSDYVKNVGKRNYIFVVHRLDQDTSGILMFCKDQKVRNIMQDNWDSMVKKRGYLAIVDGKITGKGTFHSFLVENKKQFIYSSRNGVGKEAITHYEIIKNNSNYSLAQVFIDTGRRNQIRVQFSENGYPIIGDKKYKCKTNPIKRLGLHANILEFTHPISKKMIYLKCDIPNEFKKIIK